MQAPAKSNDQFLGWVLAAVIGLVVGALVAWAMAKRHLPQVNTEGAVLGNFVVNQNTKLTGGGSFAAAPASTLGANQMTWQNCAEVCWATPGCRDFVFYDNVAPQGNPLQKGTCFLGEDPSPVSAVASGVTSGVYTSSVQPLVPPS